MSVTLSKDRARHLMHILGLSAVSLRGRNRARTCRKRFPTFRTLADPYDYFIKAYQIELEHGRVGGRLTNVTDNSEMSTAMIAAAHLKGVEYGEDSSQWKPFAAYYDWLIYMEKQPRNPLLHSH